MNTKIFIIQNKLELECIKENTRKEGMIFYSYTYLCACRKTLLRENYNSANLSGLTSLVFNQCFHLISFFRCKCPPFLNGSYYLLLLLRVRDAFCPRRRLAYFHHKSGRHFVLYVGHIVSPLNYCQRETKHRLPCTITPFY